MIKADFSKSNHLFLAYPKGFKNEYETLVLFFDNFIEQIPWDIHVYLVCNSKKTKNELEHKFSHKKIDVIVIQSWDEIWLRDCMGLFAGSEIYKFNYSPNYCSLKDEGDYYHYLNKLSKKILAETFTSNIVDVPLNIDCGNIVHNTKMAFLTEKVYEDNPGLEVEKIIKDYTGLEAVIVGRNPHDVIGHTDGYMAFKDEKTLFVSEYQNQDYLKKDIEYVKMLKRVGTGSGFEVLPVFDNPANEHISCACKKKRTRSCLYSARGLYINYIQFNDCILMPEYSLTKNSSIDYNWMNKKWLSSQGFTVIGINCDLLAKFGGSLHCLSFQC